MAQPSGGTELTRAGAGQGRSGAHRGTGVERPSKQAATDPAVGGRQVASKAPAPAELIIDLFDEIKRGRGRYISLFERMFGADGLPELSRVILTAVVVAPQPPTVPQIGRSHGFQRQTIQRHADALAEQGLIRFIDNPDHKRAHRLVATPAGLAWHRRETQQTLKWATKFVEGMNHKQLASAVATLRMVRKRLEAEARDDYRSVDR